MKKNYGLGRQKFINDLDSLVSFPTVTGQEAGFAEAFQFIKEQLHPEAKVTILENQGEKILLASNHNSLTPNILFLTHVDVVSANPNQFNLRIKEDNAYGRGVSDMKFAIPIGYALLNHLIDAKSHLAFTLAVTTDEEQGGFKGAGYLADEYDMRPQLVIVPDGGDNFVLINKSKGVCQLRITSVGKPAHASRPWNGVNAIEPLAHVLTGLLKKYHDNNHTEQWHTTMNVGFFHGGKSVNQVCPSAELGLDFRIPETITPDEIEEEVKKIARGINAKLDIEVIAIGEKTYTDPQNPTFKLFRKILQEHLGKEVAVQGEHGSNDARHFNKYGIPFLMIKPEGRDIHGDNEYINIPSVLLFYKILVDFLGKLAYP